MNIKSNERLFVSGMTGSGKSYFVTRALIPKYERYVFYDPKHGNDVPGVQVHTITDLASVIGREPRILYQPVDDDDWGFNELCRLIFQQGNYVLVMDEVMRHATTTHLPKYLDFIVRMGRQRNIGLVVGTQRPNIVHNTLISESEHFFLFRQQHPSDREKLRGFIGDAADGLNDLEEFSFVYYTFRGGAKVCAPIK